MPTDFDWKTWKKKQQEPPPPPPEEPKIHKMLEGLANALLYIVLIISFIFIWSADLQSNYVMKVVDHCNSQKGVAIQTVRGDTVCIREDALTEVLGKHSERAK